MADISFNTKGIPLDIMASYPRTSSIYTHVCFCFPLSSPQKEVIIDHLTSGLERLSASFPWIAGQVAIDPDSGVFKIIPYKSTPDIQSKTIPSIKYSELKALGFPFSMLNEKDLCPRGTLSNKSVFEEMEPAAEVFSVQVNFIEGGVLLVLQGHHSAMDMAGQSEVMRLFAKACRGEGFTRDEMRVGNMDRWGAIPLQDAAEASDISKQQGGGQEAQKTVPPVSVVVDEEEPETIWSYFEFSAQTCSAMKALAEKTVATGYISTDDAISAFIWRAITRARRPRLGDDASLTTFSRLVDTRRHLSLPQGFIGNCVHKADNTSKIGELCNADLGVIASQLRAEIKDEAAIAHGMSVRATAVAAMIEAKQFPPRNVHSHARLPTTDVWITSWAKEKCSGLDFGGLLGQVDAVRRPAFKTCEGFAFILPKARTGEMIVALCLRAEDLSRLLQADEAFQTYAIKYIG